MPNQTPAPTRKKAAKSSFTVVEKVALVLLVSVLGVLLAPQLQASADGSKERRAVSEIEAMQDEIGRFEALHHALPPDLAAIGRGTALDPWGRPYVYLPYAILSDQPGAYPPGARRDKLYRPLNSTFDLYSMGKDGMSQANIDAKVSLDDIVRARDGVVAVARNL